MNDTKTLAAELRHFNRWRRGVDAIAHPEPYKIGAMLDRAADRLEELERELQEERQDRKQADLDTIRALGERNDERALADRLAGVMFGCPSRDQNDAYDAWKEARSE